MRLRTFVLVMALASMPAFAQTSLADMEKNATQAYQDWFKLASDLDLRLARMLPCDAAVSTAIEQTSQAAMRRMSALTAYTQELAKQAGEDAAMARQIQRQETALLAAVGTERNDTELEHAAIEKQLSNLAESMRKKVSLTAAYDQLRSIEGMVRERANQVTANSAGSEEKLKQFEDLTTGLEAREADLRKQLPALEDERTKWNGYYTARMARARIECSVTGTKR